MHNPARESGNTIDKLLQDRAQYVSWLTRLNAGGDSGAAVPESVRGRVRADYERRLEAVLEQLREHIYALEEQVEGLSARAQELSVRETEHREQLAEAEVRHLVGEYDESKWEGIRAELFKLITHVHDELSHTTAEVDRLVEVLDTIRAPIIPTVEAPPPPPSPTPVTHSAPRPAVSAPPGMPGLINPTASPVPEPARPAVAPPSAAPQQQAAPAAGGSEIPFRQTAPRQTVRPTAPPAAPRKDEQQPGRTLWFPSGKPEAGTPAGGKLDELAFLKSVTGSESPPSLSATPVSSPTPVPRRASGGFSRTPSPEPPPPAPAPVPREVPSTPPPALPEPPVAKAPPPFPEPAKDRPSAGQKTLKCAECGTLNRPTEWYCERCGAELAAL